MLDQSWNRPCFDYFSWFVRLCNVHNDMIPNDADRLPPRLIRAMLQRSVSKAKPLQHVHQRELEGIARGMAPWSLAECVAL